MSGFSIWLTITGISAFICGVVIAIADTRDKVHNLHERVRNLEATIKRMESDGK